MDRGRKTGTGQNVQELFDMFEEVTKKKVPNQPSYNILGDSV